MFPNLDTPEFVASVASVEHEYHCVVDRGLALSVVRHVYTLRRKSEAGDKFRVLWNIALLEEEVADLFERDICIRVLARYFGLRAKLAAKRKREIQDRSTKEDGFPQVFEGATAWCVHVEVCSDVTATFVATKDGELEWDDVHDMGMPPWVLTRERVAAHALALAVMNSRRRQQKKKSSVE